MVEVQEQILTREENHNHNQKEKEKEAVDH